MMSRACAIPAPMTAILDQLFLLHLSQVHVRARCDVELQLQSNLMHKHVIEGNIANSEQ